jgi:hypothetical protein
MRASQPVSTINPGVCNRLLREALVTVVEMPSPFKAHRGGTCAHLCITQAGRDALATSIQGD